MKSEKRLLDLTNVNLLEENTDVHAHVGRVEVLNAKNALCVG